MEMLQTILITALLFAWLCISISFLVTSIQSFVYDRRLNATRNTTTSAWRTC